MQCKLVKILSNETITDQIDHGIKINTTGAESAYTFLNVPPGTKCTSFRVRAEKFVHLALSNVQISSSPDIMEIVIGYNGNTLIRQRSNQIPLIQTSTPTYLSQYEYRGFWVSWHGDHLIAVGRESEITPFITYRSVKPLSVQYFGIQTWSVPGSWILYGNHKCPGVSNNVPTRKHIHAETHCTWVNGTNQSHICDISNPNCHNSTASSLLNHQLNILNELKVEYTIYNSIPKRTRALSNRILREIEEQFQRAKKIQKLIFDQNNLTYEKTFDTIIQLFYKFYELIQKDLAKCYQPCRH